MNKMPCGSGPAGHLFCYLESLCGSWPRPFCGTLPEASGTAFKRFSGNEGVVMPPVLAMPLKGFLSGLLSDFLSGFPGGSQAALADEAVQDDRAGDVDAREKYE